MKLKIKNEKLKINEFEFDIQSLIKVLLENRGIKTKKEIDEFLNPKLKNVTSERVGIDKKELRKAINRIRLAIKNKEQIVVFGDYDVDGISGTAILWETLNSLGAKVTPYIPHRIDEGYGLSIKAIQNSEFRIQNPTLVITVDNGIVANKAVEFAKKQGIDVIITDHHVPSKTKPKAFAIVHTTKLCGTGVAYLLSQEFKNRHSGKPKAHPESRTDSGQARMTENSHLELVALATVADLVPLVGANRTLLKFGLEALRKTKRVGLLEIFKEAGLDKNSTGVYEIGHMIAPRLNAMGRLEYAMDSLRLLCTNNKKRAEDLAKLLGDTNRERQQIALDSALHAIAQVKSSRLAAKRAKLKVKSLLFVQHESYEQGVIGLVAGKLVEEFYRPSIVVSIGKKFSKASARSISGFNIIEFIRGSSELLIDAGGHPMAAGFTVETSKLSILQKTLENKARKLLTEENLTRSLRVDCELPLSFIDINLYEALQKLSPFGMGNPEPTFVSRKAVIKNLRLIGRDSRHLKLQIAESGIMNHELRIFDGIAFGMGDKYSELHIGDEVDVVYTIDENEWLARRSLGEGGNGEKRLQLKVKDINKN